MARSITLGACRVRGPFSERSRLYIAGDTCLWGHGANSHWKPDIAILPIGDWFTMDPRQAAHAAKLTGVDTVIPAIMGAFLF